MVMIEACPSGLLISSMPGASTGSIEAWMCRGRCKAVASRTAVQIVAILSNIQAVG